MEWEILDTGLRGAEENMQLDADLLERLGEKQQPILHFYEWQAPSVTYGYFVEPKDFLNLEEAQRGGLELARRPTGGGIVFHQWDFAFSVLIPATCDLFSLNTLENYAFVNEKVRSVVKAFMGNAEELTLTEADAPLASEGCQRFCMARPTKYDVMLGGRKIAGAAQRKTKAGFLHQGTISLLMPTKDVLEKVLNTSSAVADAMFAHTHPLLGLGATEKDLKEARQQLKGLLKKDL